MNASEQYLKKQSAEASDEKPDMDVSSMRADEAIMTACKLAFGKFQIRHFRTNYETVLYLMFCLKDPLVIQEESRTYIVLKTPAGQVLVYADPEVPPGTGFLECEGKTFKVWVAL